MQHGVCVRARACVRVPQAIEVWGSPEGHAGDVDWHQPSASSVTKLFLREREGSQ